MHTAWNGRAEYTVSSQTLLFFCPVAGNNNFLNTEELQDLFMGNILHLAWLDSIIVNFSCWYQFLLSLAHPTLLHQPLTGIYAPNLFYDSITAPIKTSQLKRTFLSQMLLDLWTVMIVHTYLPQVFFFFKVKINTLYFIWTS